MLETGKLLQQRFLIEQELARGGMGAVYLATDQKFGSRVAVKQRVHESAELAEAFEREARLLNNLQHPILPHVSDYFSEGGDHFLVMQYIEGEDLSEILKRQGAFEVRDVIRWTLELLDGLDYLHSQDPPVIHRDIKPGNLKLTSRGNIVLLDFGLAKESPGGEGVRSVFGYSRRYSPLEQIEGAGTDARSDIFSLGATVYHLLTGAAPVDAIARASSIVAGRPDPLMTASEVTPGVSAEVADVIRQAMALSPEARFSSANAMRVALEYAAGSESMAQPNTATGASPLVVPISDAGPEQLGSQTDRTRPNAGGANAGWATTKISDAAASADAAVREIPRWAARKRERMRGRLLHARPRQWSREFVAAVVLAVLLATGFVVYSWVHSSEPASAVVPETASGTAVSPGSPVQSEVAADQLEVASAQPETVDDESTSEPSIAPEERPQPTRASSKKTAVRETETVEPEAERPAPVVKQSRTNNVRERRPAPVVVRELPEVSYEDPRMIARRARRGRDRVVSETPVSSIETIFTGVPAGRRGWRRRDW